MVERDGSRWRRSSITARSRRTRRWWRRLRPRPRSRSERAAAGGLANAQARIEALLDAFPDLIFRMDRDGVYLEYKGKEEDLAVPPEQLIGAKAHDILPVDVADHLVGGVRGRSTPESSRRASTRWSSTACPGLRGQDRQGG